MPATPISQQSVKNWRKKDQEGPIQYHMRFSKEKPWDKKKKLYPPRKMIYLRSTLLAYIKENRLIQ